MVKLPVCPGIPDSKEALGQLGIQAVEGIEAQPVVPVAQLQRRVRSIEGGEEEAVEAEASLDVFGDPQREAQLCREEGLLVDQPLEEDGEDLGDPARHAVPVGEARARVDGGE